MKKPCLFLACCLSLCSYGQIISEVVGNDYKLGLNLIDQISLFDRYEIKSRGFRTAYIIYHSPSWDGGPGICAYNDTLAIYHFDSEGRIADKTAWTWRGESGTITYY